MKKSRRTTFELVVEGHLAVTLLRGCETDHVPVETAQTIPTCTGRDI